MKLIFIANIIQLVCAIILTLKYKELKHTSEKFFFHLIWFTVLVELIQIYLGYQLRVNNFIVSNSWLVVSFYFYIYWFSQILKHKKTIFFRWLYGLYTVAFLLILFTDSFFDSFAKHLFTVGALLVLYCSFEYFRHIIQSDLHQKLEVTRSFWIVCALLLFNIGMIPLMYFSEFLHFQGNLFEQTMVAFNSLFYGILSIAFLWAK